MLTKTATDATAMAAPPAPDAPLIEEGASVVKVQDVSGYLLKMPEKVRGEVMASYQGVASMVDAVFLNRVFADKARALGLDKNAAVQARLVQVQEGERRLGLARADHLKA